MPRHPYRDYMGNPKYSNQDIRDRAKWWIRRLQGISVGGVDILDSEVASEGTKTHRGRKTKSNV